MDLKNNKGQFGKNNDFMKYRDKINKREFKGMPTNL